MNWYLKALNQYADFSGRARRMEYWYFVLFNILILIACAFIDAAMGLSFGDAAAGGVLTLLFQLAILVPSLAVSVRRLHDIGRTGWWLLIGVVPLIGFIVLLVFYLTDSEPGTNMYGPNPKGDIT